MTDLDFYKKLENSYLYGDINKYIFTNEELIEYFYKLTRKDELLTEEQYTLSISSVRKKSSDDNIKITIDRNNHTITLNRYLLTSMFYKNTSDGNIYPFRYNKFSNFEYNKYLIEAINKLAAKVELIRMSKDNITYKIDPTFYVYLVNELYNYTESSELINNYQEIRNLSIMYQHSKNTSNIKISNALITNNYKNGSPMKKAMKTELEYVQYEIEDDEIFEKYNYAISRFNKNPKSSSSLLDSLLFGRNIKKRTLKYDDCIIKTAMDEKELKRQKFLDKK